MSATLLCAVLLLPGYGEKDILKRIADTGGGAACSDDGTLVVLMPANTSDADLRDLCELRNLWALTLWDTKVTHRGLRTAAGLPTLKHLHIGGASITDEGLLALESASGLESLSLQNCPNVSEEGIARLRKALLRCKIDAGFNGFRASITFSF